GAGEKMTCRPRACASATNWPYWNQAPGGYAAGLVASNPAGFLVASDAGAMRLQKSSEWIVVAPSPLILSSACWRAASPENTSVESSWKTDSCLVEACAGAAATAVAMTELVATVMSSFLSIE